MHSERDHIGLLRCVWMFSAAVDFEFGKETPTQTILRQHSPNRRLNQPFRLFAEHFSCSGSAYSAWVAGMTMVQFGLWLGSSKLDLGRVDDDHKITRVLMRGEIGTVFAAQNDCCARRDTPKRAPFRVNKDPSPHTQAIFARDAFSLFRQFQVS